MGVGSGSRPVLFGAKDDGGRFGRVLGRKPITRFGKVKQPFCMVDLVSDEKRAHQTPGLFWFQSGVDGKNIQVVLHRGYFTNTR